MSLEQMKADLDKEKAIQLKALIDNRMFLEGEMSYAEDRLAEALTDYETRRFNWHKEVRDSWDDDYDYDPSDLNIYGTWYDEEMYEMRKPVDVIQESVDEYNELLLQVETAIDCIAEEFNARWHKIKTDYEEVAVLRWLS